MAAAWSRICSNVKLCNLYKLISSKTHFFTSTCLFKAKFCSAAKPFHFHPISKTIEGKQQAIYLTKMVVKDELPSRIQNTVIDDDIKQELMARYRQSIIQSRLFNYEGEVSTKTTCALSLTMNMMNAVWSQTNRFPSLQEKSLTYKPRVTALWQRHENHIMVSGNVGFLISSKTPLPLFADDDEVQITKQDNMEGLELISPVFDMYQVSKAKADNDTGFHPSSPYPYANTMVIVNTNKQFKLNDRCAQGIMFTFARALNQATDRDGNKYGSVLKHPIAAQCVISDGYRLTFIAVQLNTTDFMNDDGVKNIAWVVPGVQMYKKASFNEENTQSDVEEFNDECFEIFSKVMISGLAQ